MLGTDESVCLEVQQRSTRVLLQFIAQITPIPAKPSSPRHARQAGRAKHGAAQLRVQLQKLRRPCLQNKFANKKAKAPVATPPHSRTAGARGGMSTGQVLTAAMGLWLWRTGCSAHKPACWPGVGCVQQVHRSPACAPCRRC
jgi:hypothetical protein